MTCDPDKHEWEPMTPENSPTTKEMFGLNFPYWMFDSCKHCTTGKFSQAWVDRQKDA